MSESYTPLLLNQPNLVCNLGLCGSWPRMQPLLATALWLWWPGLMGGEGRLGSGVVLHWCLMSSLPACLPCANTLEPILVLP